MERAGFVCALGEDLPVEPLPGLRGAALSPDDPVRGEWDVTVLGPHFSAALLPRDLGDDGPDAQRRFAYALTYDRDTVVRATAALLARVAPRQEPLPSSPRPGAAAAVPAAVPTAGRFDVGVLLSATGDTLVQGALAATPSGVSIVDVRLPDQPLVYVNPAFERLAGLPGSELLGRNCRFLQSPDSDPAAVAAIRGAVDAGEECRVTVLNHRGPERTPWWNELHLAPVTGADGTVTHYIGTQVDVTARVEAERALVQERDRTVSYLARIEELAYTDPLTGLPNRRRLTEQVDTAIWNARARSEAVALLFVDLMGFKGVNDRFGHAVGDELLVAVAERLRGRLRRGDLLARLGGDEFLVALTGLPEATAGAEADRIAGELAAVVACPVACASTRPPSGRASASASGPRTARTSRRCCTRRTCGCTRRGRDVRPDPRRVRSGRCGGRPSRRSPPVIQRSVAPFSAFTDHGPIVRGDDRAVWIRMLTYWCSRCPRPWCRRRCCSSSRSWSCSSPRRHPCCRHRRRSKSRSKSRSRCWSSTGRCPPRRRRRSWSP
ncbi:MAG: diguanylate cyclase [Actinomycetota bacterium]|nr:diguanylate cyclase [Actinomycetota bacterium]